ncbi:hypothetical protein AGLY_015095 [Aphis glycines]|uniref:DRBM domain-containing protein n=1 Tax=Aphis glycines TaxID=307491 RepID=A0A6G0T3M7_APHGL|nr:hypothetical protein AGLY_015095 [Aphis glycines]
MPNVGKSLGTYGYGSSSNEATNDAANRFLDKLTFISEIDDYLLNSTNPPCLESTVKLAQSINYIGKLQELCVARAWNVKEYEYCQNIEGEYNNKEHFFTVICSARPYKSKGVGKTKKIAKNQTAYSMLNQININQHKTNNTYSSNERGKMNKMENEKLGLSISIIDKNEILCTITTVYHINSDGMFKNYMGILQDICMAHGWKLLKYEYHKENNKYSVIICSVGL